MQIIKINNTPVQIKSYCPLIEIMNVEETELDYRLNCGQEYRITDANEDFKQMHNIDLINYAKRNHNKAVEIFEYSHLGK